MFTVCLQLRRAGSTGSRLGIEGQYAQQSVLDQLDIDDPAGAAECTA